MYAPVLVEHCCALLNEVERLTNDLAMARQVSGELCEACGWAMKFPGEPCRCKLLDEVERLKAREESLVKQSVAQIGMIGRQAEWCEGAFKRGAEAMREAAAQRCEISPIHGQKTTTARRYADAVRTTPIPEDKP
jgi:hypothetical protein